MNYEIYSRVFGAFDVFVKSCIIAFIIGYIFAVYKILKDVVFILFAYPQYITQRIKLSYGIRSTLALLDVFIGLQRMRANGQNVFP